MGGREGGREKESFSQRLFFLIFFICVSTDLIRTKRTIRYRLAVGIRMYKYRSTVIGYSKESSCSKSVQYNLIRGEISKLNNSELRGVRNGEKNSIIIQESFYTIIVTFTVNEFYSSDRNRGKNVFVITIIDFLVSNH